MIKTGRTCTYTAPCAVPIEGGMRQGRVIRIQGSTPTDADSFEINLQETDNLTSGKDDRTGNIPVHIVFNFADRRYSELNSFRDGKWLDPQFSHLPVAEGTNFEAVISCDQEYYFIYFGDQFYCDFAHEVPVTDIQYLTIFGDVHLQYVGFEGAGVLDSPDRSAPAPVKVPPMLQDPQNSQHPHMNPSQQWPQTQMAGHSQIMGQQPVKGQQQTTGEQSAPAPQHNEMKNLNRDVSRTRFLPQSFLMGTVPPRNSEEAPDEDNRSRCEVM